MQTMAEQKRREKFVELAIILFVFTVHIWGVWNYDNIIIIKDEFGYWEHAAKWAGHDWTGVMGSIEGQIFPWYSWGYSLLLLPLFAFCKYMSSMYRLAVLLNGFMLIAVYFIVKDLSGKLCREIDEKKKIIIAAAVSLYSAYIVQAKVAWAEILSYFLLWLFLWFFYKMLETEKTGYCIFTSCLVGAAYIVHNRMLVLYIAWFLIVLVMSAMHDLDWKKLISLILPALLFYWLNGFIKDQLQAFLMSSTPVMYGMNDIESRAWRIKRFCSGDGITYGIQEMIGELFYLGAATFLTAYIGIVQLVSGIIKEGRAWRNRDARKKMYFMLLTVLSFLGILALSTLVNMPVKENILSVQQSYFYYGRYLDGIAGILLFFGLLALNKWDIRQNIKIILLAEALLGIFAKITSVFAGKSGNEELNLICVPGVWLIGKLEEKSTWDYFLIISIPVLLVYGIFILLKKYRKGGIVFLATVLAAAFTGVGLWLADNFIAGTQEEQGEIIGWLQENTTNDTIYFADTDGKIPYYLQAGLVDRHVCPAVWQDLENTRDALVVTPKRISREKFHECAAGTGMFVYMTEGEKYTELEKAGKLQLKNMKWKIDSEDIERTGFHVPEMGGWAWTSAGEAALEGILEADDYEVTLTMGPELPFAQLPFDEYRVRILVNGKQKKEWILSDENYETDNGKLVFEINREDLQPGINRITLQTDTLWSPQEYGGLDERQMGISVSELEFREKK